MKPIAYFSSEYAFDDMPIFAGGLGVLAADFLKRAGADGVPFVGVGLFYHYGFAPRDESKKQYLDIKSHGWEIVKQGKEPLILSLRLKGEDIYFQAWQKQTGTTKLYLLDCDVANNSPKNKRITANLYDKDFNHKVMQNAVLGLGGVELLEALKIKPQVFHLNEGHTAFVAIARLAHHKQAKPYATFEELCEAVIAETVATKHTVLSGAGLYIDRKLFRQIFDSFFEDKGLLSEEVFALAQDPLRKDDFTTTRLMLNMAHTTNTVSKSHLVYEDELHPDSEFKMISITNGINIDRWQSPEIAAAKDEASLWQAHVQLKQLLIDFINERVGSSLTPDILTVVWARRIAAYKRPLELFEDLKRLQRVVTHPDRPVQIIIAGKPNIEDEVGIEMAREIGEHALNKEFGGRIAYMEDYNLEVAKKLVTGADVWLNTPQKGYEASGTSGMKAGSNGVLQCSVSDGWVDEVEMKSGGWILPDINTADALYGFLEYEIAPCFYGRDENGLPVEWLEHMNRIITLIESGFTTRRMLKEYKKLLYKIH